MIKHYSRPANRQAGEGVFDPAAATKTYNCK